MTDTKGIKGFGANSSPLDRIWVVTEEGLECPFCHRSIETQPLTYVKFETQTAQILLKCNACKDSFIGYTRYNTNKDQHYIFKLSKGNHKTTEFSEEIKKLSPMFAKIFGQAESAEQEGLLEICGVGYRKALEFLIKDYLIQTKPEDEESIKEKFLGNCIKEDIDNPKIKKIAEKATWLGNDETHYVRKWEDKDLEDLKTLINITVHFISMEIEANKYIEEMEKPK